MGVGRPVEVRRACRVREACGGWGAYGGEWGPVEMGGARMEPGQPEGRSHSPSCQEAQGGQVPQKLQVDPTDI